jgi:NADH:ubiquinone oxidoreductase subunit 4 (subunit M)
MLSGLIGVAYNIYFYEKIFLGTLNTRFVNKFMDMTLREFFVILPLFLCSIFFFINPMFLMSYLNLFFIFLLN